MPGLFLDEDDGGMDDWDDEFLIWKPPPHSRRVKRLDSLVPPGSTFVEDAQPVTNKSPKGQAQQAASPQSNTGAIQRGVSQPTPKEPQTLIPNTRSCKANAGEQGKRTWADAFGDDLAVLCGGLPCTAQRGNRQLRIDTILTKREAFGAEGE